MQAALVNGAETRRARNLGLGVWAIVVGLAIAAIYGDSEPVSIGSWGYVAVAATVAAAVWLLLVMRPLSRSEGNTPGLVGFITGIVALAANVVFWIPFAFVLGCGAVLLGVEGRRRSGRGAGRGGLSTAGIVLGGVGVALFSAIWLTAWITGSFGN